MGSEVVEQDEQPGLLTLLEQGQRAIGIAERRTFRNLRYRADAPGFPSAKSLAHLSDERDMGYLPSGNVERDVAAANPRHVCPRYSTTLAVKQYGMLFRTS